jgi:RNA polymerase II subunit A small phosphatase-like protein
VTSSAVQPPGSGSELLSTPQRPHAVRRESDANSTHQQTGPIAVGGSDGSREKTDTSGGYSDISDSDVRSGDENVPPTSEEGEYGLEEEYEDEEDRLIAQGGMGIPLDEVSNGLMM